MCAKLFATVNTATEAKTLERGSTQEPWQLADGPHATVERNGPGMYNVERDGQVHRVLVLKEDPENNSMRIRIGTGTYTVAMEDEHERLVRALGLDKVAGAAVKDLKAPMPGLVLQILVKPGDVVKKNDPVLVLEAMKMENVIKSPGDATIKEIMVQERVAVEKGQLLITFG